MGENLLKFYKKKVKKEYKLAFFITFFLGLLIHMYKFTNVLPNADSIFNYYNDQNIVNLGRWSLSLACSISSYFELPWVIGILSCIYIALTVVVIVSLFKVKNPVVIFLIGGLLVSSPSIIEIFEYMYTADGYMLAMLLSALAVYLSRIEEKRVFFKVLSCVLLCFSCGIYQAYVNFALILVLCNLILILIENKHSKKECLNWILQQIIIFILALASYYIIWQLMLKYTDFAASDYLGINKISGFGLDYIIYGFDKVIKTFMNYFFLWSYGNVSLVQYNMYSILFAIFSLIIIIKVMKDHLYKRKWALIIFIVALILIIPCSSFWHFTSKELSIAAYTPRMLQCYTLLYILIVILYEKYARAIGKNLCAILMVLIIFYNAIIANIIYYYLDYSYKNTYADGVQMMQRINEVASNREDINDIVFIGSKPDRTNPKFPGDESTNYKYSIVMTHMYDNLLYDWKHAYVFLYETFHLKYNCLNFKMDQKYELIFHDHPEVKKMKSWPATDSVAIVDNVIVVKISDHIEEIGTW